jgi:hypothetical protein
VGRRPTTMKLVPTVPALAALLLAVSACGSADPHSADSPGGNQRDVADSQPENQPPRPHSEVVPPKPREADVGWRLAPGGTPVRKVLTGRAADMLAADFNKLRVSTRGEIPCPMSLTGRGITVSFHAQGHTWTAEIARCPGIEVSRDGHALPTLQPGTSFLADVRQYAGRLFGSGPSHSGGMTPLMYPRSQ